MTKPLQSKKVFFVLLTSLLPAMTLWACGKGQNEFKSQAELQNPSVPVIEVVSVERHQLKTALELPGELEAYQDVPLHAKVEGYVSSIMVDRGSVVHKGQPLATITAPELDAKVKEAIAKVSACESAYRQAQSNYLSVISKEAQVKAKLDADELTFNRLTQAAKTPGAIAQNEVDMAQKAAEADKANVESLKSEVVAAAHLVAAQKQNVLAARNVAESIADMSSYLKITAPFDGVVTERNVHEGSIVAVDAARTSLPMLRVQQKSLLRLVVAVPEDSVAGVKLGTKIPFSVPAFLGKTFEGTIARLGFALDTKTRTMPVELDVPNSSGELEPGMFATVKWSVTRPYGTLFVPLSAVTTDLKGTFVVRIKDGIAQRVAVTRGQQMGNLVEVVGDLKDGDQIALKATDEIKLGIHMAVKQADLSQIEGASQHTSAAAE